MYNTIAFTPSQVINIILLVCSAIWTISLAIGVVAKVVEKFKSPDAKRDERIMRHESRLNEHDERFELLEKRFRNDDERIKSINEGNKVTQQAILALMSHALNGNDVEHLSEAKDALERYLINK